MNAKKEKLVKEEKMRQFYKDLSEQPPYNGNGQMGTPDYAIWVGRMWMEEHACAARRDGGKDEQKQ